MTTAYLLLQKSALVQSIETIKHSLLLPQGGKIMRGQEITDNQLVGYLFFLPEFSQDTAGFLAPSLIFFLLFWWLENHLNGGIKNSFHIL